MATSQLRAIVGRLRTTALLADGAEATDGHLVERFLTQHDEAAFAVLVRRHGPMVLAVCRRVLGNWHDAEDAFQATFLVLVRKAATIGRQELLGPWLYGVAYRTAKKAQTARFRRLAKETQAAVKTSSAAESTKEFLPLLDQEMHGLPEKYRLPVVLCDLEGKTRKEAARLVGCPEGTLSTRLGRGRTLLARRLSRRGVALSVASLAVLLPQAAEAFVPPTLIATIARVAATMATGSVEDGASSAVLALANGVSRAMWLTKWKILAAALVAGACLGGGLVLREQPTRTGEHANRRPESASQAERAETNTAQLQDKLLTLEKQILDALKKQDPDALKRMTAADFAAVLSDGKRFDRDGVIALWESMHFRLQDYSLEDVRLIRITTEAAVLTYREKAAYTIHGMLMSQDLCVSSTWARRDGKWWNVFYQETVIAP
jgi:RNA polymerase sigma factor (sigma-70 family)